MGMALAESTSRSLYDGTSFDDLSDDQKLAVMERLGGSVTVGAMTSVATGAPLSGDTAVPDAAPQLTSDTESVRSRVGSAATMLVVSGEQGVEKAVNWMGKDTATALAYVAMAAMGGPVKTAGSYLFDSSPQGQWLYQQKEGLLVRPLAGLVGTYGFDAQTDAEQQGVYPASHVISSVAVDTVLSTIGAIGVNKGVKSIVEGAEGFSKKVDAADHLVEDGAKGAGQALREVEVNSGGKGSWSKELNNPEPNTLYKVDGNKTYQTDSLGRVEKVESDLSLSKRDRNTYQQCVAGKCGASGDEGGHLIASIFEGPGEKLNLLPMNGNLNKGAWKSMENKWSVALKEGKAVNVKIEPVYTGGSISPEKFTVTYQIGSGRPIRETFVNSPGGI